MATVLVFLKVFSRCLATIESDALVSSTADNADPRFSRGEKTKSSSSEPPPYSPSRNLTSSPAAMSDLAILAHRLFLELDSSGEALFPCGRFLGSAVAGGGEEAGADERFWGFWLGVQSLPPPSPPPLQLCHPCHHSWGFWRVFGICGVLLAFAFITVTFFLCGIRPRSDDICHRTHR